MKKDKSVTERSAKKQGVGAAHAGVVIAPVWVQDETSAEESSVEFALAKVKPNHEPTPLFEPVDLFDILEVVQLLAEKLSTSPLVEDGLRMSLERMSKDLTALNQNQLRPVPATTDRRRETPSLKVVSSPTH